MTVFVSGGSQKTALQDGTPDRFKTGSEFIVLVFFEVSTETPGRCPFNLDPLPIQPVCCVYLLCILACTSFNLAATAFETSAKTRPRKRRSHSPSSGPGTFWGRTKPGRMVVAGGSLWDIRWPDGRGSGP